MIGDVDDSNEEDLEAKGNKLEHQLSEEIKSQAELNDSSSDSGSEAQNDQNKKKTSQTH